RRGAGRRRRLRGSRARQSRLRQASAPDESYAWIPSAAMRFPVVLFDLDGTVVDSGAIILASMRHAAREVLGIEPPDEELMAAVGGPGLEAQMRALAPDRFHALLGVYRGHNDRLHGALACCD